MAGADGGVLSETLRDYNEGYIALDHLINTMVPMDQAGLTHPLAP